MKPVRHLAKSTIAPKSRIGFRAFIFATFAALFGVAPAAQAEDRGRGTERGRETEIERGKERGQWLRDIDRGRERSTGHDVDAGGKESDKDKDE